MPAAGVPSTCPRRLGIWRGNQRVEHAEAKSHSSNDGERRRLGQSDEVKPEMMSGLQEYSEPAERTQEEPEYACSLPGWVPIIGEEAQT
jgi:hypothetical protein